MPSTIGGSTPPTRILETMLSNTTTNRKAVRQHMTIFKASFWECICLAGPGVLMGAGLTGVFAKLVLPYNWTWYFSFTFGAILAATDPVAVVALLKVKTEKRTATQRSVASDERTPARLPSAEDSTLSWVGNEDFNTCCC